MTTHQHMRVLDGVRGFACLIVVLVHGVSIFLPEVAIYGAGVGKIGVWLFFVLSAFLLTSNFLRDGVSPDTVLSYAISRTLRIWPPFIVAVLVAYGTGTLGITTLGDAWRVVTFQSGPAHLWTIPVEFKFYIVLPFIARAIIYVRGKFGSAFTMGALVVAIVVHQIFFPYTQLIENSVQTTWYLSSFLLGCVGAVAVLGKEPRFERGRMGFLIGLSVLVFVIASLPYVRHILFGTPADRLLMNKYLFFSAAWVVFIVSQTRCPNLLSRLFSCTPLVKIGDWSYSIYLFHLFVLLIVGNWLGIGALNLCLALPATILIGCVMYITIEKPFFRLRKYLEMGTVSRVRRQTV